MRTLPRLSASQALNGFREIYENEAAMKKGNYRHVSNKDFRSSQDTTITPAGGRSAINVNVLSAQTRINMNSGRNNLQTIDVGDTTGMLESKNFDTDVLNDT